MNTISRFSLITLLSALILNGCSASSPRDGRYIKDGREYGVTEGFIWKPTWWNYYERGLSFNRGGFREEALADLRIAAGEEPGAREPRPDDQRRVRTYGLHFIEDYFPRREMGIIYYRLGDYEDAQAELERSLLTADSARARYYLNLTRKELLQSRGVPVVPPSLNVTTPRPNRVVNTPVIRIAGSIQSPNYVRAVTVDGKKLYLELAEKSFQFDEPVNLRPGNNLIKIEARGLLGGKAELTLPVTLDLQPPLVYIDEYIPGSPEDLVKGAVMDDGGIAHLRIDGRDVKIGDESREAAFSRGIEPNGKIRIEAEDQAGNSTKVEITPSVEFSRSGVRSPPVSRGFRLFDLILGEAYARETDSGDSHSPEIILDRLEDKVLTPYSHYVFSGRVRDENRVSSIMINGKNIIRREAPLIYFNHRAELREGVNPIRITAVDIDGNEAVREFAIIRKTPEIWQTSSRYSLALLPLAPSRRPGRARADELHGLLLTSFLSPPERFNLLERSRNHLETILTELKIGSSRLADRDAALQVGKIITADGILFGKVVEEDGISVHLWLVDTETTEIIHYAEVYDEDSSLPNLRFLMDALALKFKQYFPLVSGRIIWISDGGFSADLGSEDGIRPGMKYLPYREVETGKGRVKIPLKIAAKNIESRVTMVENNSSYAEVRPEEGIGKIHKGDYVITK